MREEFKPKPKLGLVLLVAGLGLGYAVLQSSGWPDEKSLREAWATLPETARGLLIGALALSAGGLGILLDGFFSQKRSAALSTVAAQMGFSLSPLGDLSDTAFSSLQLFREAGRISSILQGRSNGAEIVLCDYRVPRGKTSYTQTVACFRVGGRTLPEFRLSPETVFHKFASLFGYKDINFDAHPEFSNKYLLRGEDEAAIRSLFQAGVPDFFTREEGWSVEGAGNWLGVYRYGRRVKPADLPSFLEQAKRIYHLFAAR